MDDLTQFDRRFHKCTVPTETLDTDSMVVDLCKDKLGIQLSEEDTFRLQSIGKPNSNDNIEIICRFKNWIVKNKVYKKMKF